MLSCKHNKIHFYMLAVFCDSPRMANNLPTEQKANVISMLAEGNSIRSIERITGIHRDTVNHCCGCKSQTKTFEPNISAHTGAYVSGLATLTFARAPGILGLLAGSQDGLCYYFHEPVEGTL
jgi:hypothetical protein